MIATLLLSPSRSLSKEIVISAGDFAPYRGVLLDEDRFKYYKTTEKKSELLESMLSKPECPDMELEGGGESYWLTLGVFVFGASVGLIAGANLVR